MATLSLRVINPFDGFGAKDLDINNGIIILPQLTYTLWLLIRMGIFEQEHF